MHVIYENIHKRVFCCSCIYDTWLGLIVQFLLRYLRREFSRQGQRPVQRRRGRHERLRGVRVPGGAHCSVRGDPTVAFMYSSSRSQVGSRTGRCVLSDHRLVRRALCHRQQEDDAHPARLVLRLDHLQLMLSFVIGIEWVARAW